MENKSEKKTESNNRFEPLQLFPAYGMGYHTRYKGGEMVHPTRENIEFARLLLEQSDPDEWERAASIISKVLSMQERREDNLCRGVWPWFAEEPVKEMSPPDRNWADFIGAQLCEMLVLYNSRLPALLREDMLQSLRLACEHILQRNIGPAYTNICAMGAAVTCIGGELLHDERFCDYGLRRLHRLDQHVAGYDLFDEYNSPVYTPILIQELDRIIRLARSERAKELASRLKRLAMRGVEDHFHTGIGEWGGAQSRAYRDRLGPVQKDFLLRHGLYVNNMASCSKEKTIRANVPGSKCLTTWSNEVVTIGCSSRSAFWSQARPIIAYWKGDDKKVCVFRVRVMIDGRDFASAEWSAVQSGPDILAAIALAPERGIWHTMIDKPADGLVRCRDLRARFEIQPDYAPVDVDLGRDYFTLFSCGYGVCASIGEAVLAGRKAIWERGECEPDASDDRGDWFPTDDTHGGVTPGSTWVDAVFSAGPGQDFVFRTEEFMSPNFVMHLAFRTAPFEKFSHSKPTISGNQATCISRGHLLKLSLTPPLAPREMARSWLDPFWLSHPSAWLDRMRKRFMEKYPLIKGAKVLFCRSLWNIKKSFFRRW
jgi:hypothetical protein